MGRLLYKGSYKGGSPMLTVCRGQLVDGEVTI